MMPIGYREVAICCLGVFGAVLSAAAQGPVQRDRVLLHLGAVGGFPVGEFSRFVGSGFGGNLGTVINVDQDHVFGLRIDGGFLVYGLRRRPVPIVPGLVATDVVTSNAILSAGIGPQITLPFDVVRPYIAGTAGFSYFYTTSSLTSGCGCGPTSTNFFDWSFSATALGGLQLRIVQGRKPVFIDLSAAYQYNGPTTYLTERSVQPSPSGFVIVHPVRSQANLLMMRIGVSLGVG